MKKHTFNITKEALQKAENKMAQIFESAFPEKNGEMETTLIDAIIQATKFCQTPEELILACANIVTKYERAITEANKHPDIKIFSATAGHAL